MKKIGGAGSEKGMSLPLGKGENGSSLSKGERERLKKREGGASQPRPRERIYSRRKR